LDWPQAEWSRDHYSNLLTFKPSHPLDEKTLHPD